MLVETELNKLEKFDVAYFRGKNYFAESDGIQNYLVFQQCTNILKQLIILIISQSESLKDCLLNVLKLLVHLIILSILY